MSETNQGYRKKQALLVLVVFACIGVVILGYQSPGERGRHGGGLRRRFLCLQPGAGKEPRRAPPLVRSPGPKARGLSSGYGLFPLRTSTCRGGVTCELP